MNSLFTIAVNLKCFREEQCLLESVALAEVYLGWDCWEYQLVYEAMMTSTFFHHIIISISLYILQTMPKYLELRVSVDQQATEESVTSNIHQRGYCQSKKLI